jgi:hypothetical protein
MPQLLFYRGIRNVPVQTGPFSGSSIPPASMSTGTAPIGSYHNYDYNGTQTGDYSLAWKGPDGLLNTWHKEWMHMMATSSPVKFQISLTINDLLELDMLVAKRINNQVYMVDEIEVEFSDTMGLCMVTAWPIKTNTP